MIGDEIILDDMVDYRSNDREWCCVFYYT